MLNCIVDSNAMRIVLCGYIRETAVQMQLPGIAQPARTTLAPETERAAKTTFCKTAKPAG